MRDFTPSSNTPSPTHQSTQDRQLEDDEIDLLELWNTLWSKRVFIAKVTGTSMVLALIYALLSPVTYKAETIIVSASETQNTASSLTAQLGGLASLAGVNLGGDQSTDTTLAILKSRTFLVDFVKENHLAPILFPNQWNTKTNQWDDPESTPGDLAIHQSFGSLLSANQDQKTQLITVAIEWKDPEQAATWVNQIVKHLNDHLRSHDISQSERNIQFLQEQLKTTSLVEIQRALYQMIENQTKTKMLANTREDYAFRVLDPAITPEQRTKPKRTLIVILGSILGVMLGIFLAFAKDFVDKQKARNKA